MIFEYSNILDDRRANAMLWRCFGIKNAARLGAALVAGMLTLTACEQTIKETVSPISCYFHQEALLDAEENFSETIVQSVTLGSVADSLVGSLHDRDVESAVKRASMRGISNVAADYFKIRYNEAGTREDSIVSMRDDFIADNRQLDEAGRAMDALAQCRISQYEAILSDPEAGRVDRNTALTRKEDVDFKITRDVDLMDTILEGSEKRAKDFKSALYVGFGLLPGKIPGKRKYEKYVVLAKANARSKPGGPIIGGLFEGERVHIPPGNEDKAWQPIVWFDGKTVYVHIELLAHQDSGMAANALARVGGRSKNFEIEKLSAFAKDRRRSVERKGHDYRRKIKKIRDAAAIRLELVEAVSY